jgi:hypothetical protein
LLTLLIFICHAQALSSHFNVKPAKDDVVTLSSSDTKEALELLSLNPARGPHSPLLKLRSSSGSDLFDDWPEANDMAVSIYVALTTDASSSCTSIVNALHYAQKSCVDGSSTQQSRTQATLSQKHWCRKSAFTSAPQRKPKKMKIATEYALAMPIPCGGSLSAADFDRSEWEILHPLFVEEGLIDPSERVSRKDA